MMLNVTVDVPRAMTTLSWTHPRRRWGRAAGPQQPWSDRWQQSWRVWRAWRTPSVSCPAPSELGLWPWRSRRLCPLLRCSRWDNVQICSYFYVCVCGGERLCVCVCVCVCVLHVLVLKVCVWCAVSRHCVWIQTCVSLPSICLGLLSVLSLSYCVFLSVN